MGIPVFEVIVARYQSMPGVFSSVDTVRGWAVPVSCAALAAAFAGFSLLAFLYAFKRNDLGYRKKLWLMGASLLACASAPLTLALEHWNPGLDAGWGPHALTAAGAWMTLVLLAVILFKNLNPSRLHTVNRQLKREIELREQLEKDLMRTIAEMDEFTYIAGHDLQEPMRKMAVFCDFLRKDLHHPLPARVDKDLHFIMDACDRMQSLVMDLLKLSRMGRAKLDRKPVSMDECADWAIDSLSELVAESRAEITRDPLPEIRADPSMMQHVYLNLIQNAIKYSAGGPPRIRLTAGMVEGQTILGVRDNGIGIKPVYHEQIFAPFKRVHGQYDVKGSGIGLAICRKVLERQGGRIWVESEPGRGAHFKFTIPQQLAEPKRRIAGQTAGDAGKT